MCAVYHLIMQIKLLTSQRRLISDNFWRKYLDFRKEKIIKNKED